MMHVIQIIKSIIVLIGISIFLIALTLILPFFVQERLMLLCTILFFIVTLFNGKITSSNKIKYVIKSKN